MAINQENVLKGLENELQEKEATLTPEKPESLPETGSEQVDFSSARERVLSEIEKAHSAASASPKKTAIPVQKVAADPVYRKVENVLEDGLFDFYSKLDKETKAEFRQKGEETATKINQLMKQAKVKAKQIFELIINWLKIIPGVNRFFLEQEAKIKTARILAIKNDNDNHTTGAK